MIEMSWGQIIKRNKLLGTKMSLPIKKIALISNISIFPLKEILELDLREQGLSVEVEVGDYDSIIQDSNRFSNCDVAIIFFELSNIIEGFHYLHYSVDDQKLNSLLTKVESEVSMTLDNLENVPLVLINSFSSIYFDPQPLSKSRASFMTDRLNAFLHTAIKKNQIVVNLEKIISITGLANTFDDRQYQFSKSLYTKNFLINYAEQIRPAFLASNGSVKKILVLDCDNTLWGGILGEDGEQNLEMNNLTNKGKSFNEVQHLFKSYQQQGVLLALCSKNNPEDVENILINHSDMILKNEDFVAKKVNWNDKVKNLIDLSSELNLGLDSFIFIDDSQFEIGLVQKELPEVESILVPSELSNYPKIIKGLQTSFFSFSRTDEDSKKTSMYLQESIRKESSSSFKSIDDYLKSLELRLKITHDDPVLIERGAQMSQKTNQFNLRTQRYTESEISNFVSSPKNLVSNFSLDDKYGEYGVTGLAILALETDEAFIDTFLMSCRVIGRNVEFSFFSAIVMQLAALRPDIKILKGEWIKSMKNQQVMNFYDELGFECTFDGGENREYSLTLASFKSKAKDYINF